MSSIEDHNCPNNALEIKDGTQGDTQCVSIRQEGQSTSTVPTYTFGRYGQRDGMLTRREFLKLPILMEEKKVVRIAVIMCYICAALTALSYYFSLGEWSIDAALMLIVGLFIHIRKSFAASVVYLLYSISSIIIVFYRTKEIGGYLSIIAGILAVLATNNIRKAYKAYSKDGVLPEKKLLQPVEEAAWHQM